MHSNENLVYVFPEKELRGLSPNFHIHVSLSIFSCSRISRPIVGIYKPLTETWMWKLGPFLGIFVLNFLCCVFEVWLTNSYVYWKFAEGRQRANLYYGFLDNVCSSVEFRDCSCGPQVMLSRESKSLNIGEKVVKVTFLKIQLLNLILCAFSS